MTTTPKPSLGALLFRWRSYLPLLAVAALIGGLIVQGPTTLEGLRLAVGSGLMLALTGLVLRVYAVGQAPPGTSGRHRRQHAARLNTFGVYSVMRHPLYLGNLLVWSGLSLTSGWLPGAAASVAAGIVMFGLIVRHEDAYLARTFGSDFEEWASITPAFRPRPSLWRPTRRRFRWARAIASEYSTLHTVGITALVFIGVRVWKATGTWAVGRPWWILLALNSAVYLALRAWRSKHRQTSARLKTPDAAG